MTELTEELQERIDIIIHKLKFIEQKPTVACIQQLEPLQLVDNEQMAQMITIAGGITVTDIYTDNPDIIIVMPTGYTIERSIKEIGDILPRIAGLKAVKDNRFYIVNGQSYFNDSDSNDQLVDEIELLAEIINPKQFIFGYEGDGWVKFSL